MTISSFLHVRLLLDSMPAESSGHRAVAMQRNDSLTKPPGSLGRLEDIALWLAAWQRRNPPVLENVTCIVPAGNHGVTVHGVSAFPSEVTTQMVANFRGGGAAINQLANLLGAELVVIPVDLDCPTRDFTTGPAMTEEETCAALQTGFDSVNNADLICIGEMGIGNTTAAAALCASLFGGSGHDWAGPGTGLDRRGVDNKARVIDSGLAANDGHTIDPLRSLACFGGREMAAIVGVILACRHARIPVVLDGFVCCASAAVLHCLQTDALAHCLVGHVSAEPHAAKLVERLDMAPILDLGMRLGECSGAAAAALLVRAAVATHGGMATFAEAGVDSN